jgi:hypothetical protein
MFKKNNYLLSLVVIGIIITVLIYAAGKKMFAPAKGAWFIAYPQSTNEMMNITDEPYEFKLDDMSCGATKTQFSRRSDGYRIEARELYCWTSEDTYVSTTVNCNMHQYSTQGLAIKKKNNFYMPILMCGPEKKGTHKIQ